jgi:hypothetical protein
MYRLQRHFVIYMSSCQLLKTFSVARVIRLRSSVILHELTYVPCGLLQSSGKSDTYSSIIVMLTPALTELAAALADNVTAALTPTSLLQQYKQQQQQQQQWPDSEQQQPHPQHLPEASVGDAGAVSRGTAAAEAASADSGSGAAAAAAVPLPGGEEEARTAFKVVRHLVELMRDIKERCR